MINKALNNIGLSNSSSRNSFLSKCTLAQISSQAGLTLFAKESTPSNMASSRNFKKKDSVFQEKEYFTQDEIIQKINDRASVHNINHNAFNYKKGSCPSPKSLNPDNISKFNNVLAPNYEFDEVEFKKNPYHMNKKLLTVEHQNFIVLDRDRKF